MSSSLLVAVSLKDRPVEEYTFDTDMITVGRDADCDVLIDNAGVSRAHAEIERTEGGVVVRDKGSSNGTWVNDDRIESDHVLGDGDLVRIGKFSIAVSVGSGSSTDDVEQERAEPAGAPPQAVGGTIMLTPKDIAQLKAREDALRATAEEPDPPSLTAYQVPIAERVVQRQADTESAPAPKPELRTFREELGIAIPSFLFGTAIGVFLTWLFMAV